MNQPEIPQIKILDDDLRKTLEVVVSEKRFVWQVLQGGFEVELDTSSVETDSNIIRLQPIRLSYFGITL